MTRSTMAVEARFTALVATGGIAVGLALIVTAIAGGGSARTAAPIALAIIVAGSFHRTLLAWRSMIATIVLVIMFIPIKRYALPGHLPIALEPYRLIVGLAAMGWISAALVDPAVRLRRTGAVDVPLAVFGMCALMSLLLNLTRVQSVSSDAIKSALFFLSYIVVVYFLASVTTRLRDIEFLLRTIVGSAAVVAVFALVESRTGYNVFLHLNKVFPFLHSTKEIEHLHRGGHLRAQGSAQHAIALGAAMALVVPLALAVAATARRLWWWLAFGFIMLAALATVSRTAVVMFATAALVFLWLRPAQTRRFAPFALIPLVVGIHFALPGALGTLRKSFSHQQLIVKSQNAPVGAGRLSTFGPAFDTEFKPNPLFGEGFGTRVTQPDASVPEPNAPILDDQWLGILLETGIAGATSLAFIFIVFVRRIGRAAKADDSRLGWMMTGIAAAVASYAIAMFTFDIFSFVQVTFLMFILIGLGCVSLRAWQTAHVPAEIA